MCNHLARCEHVPEKPKARAKREKKVEAEEVEDDPTPSTSATSASKKRKTVDQTIFTVSKRQCAVYSQPSQIAFE
jgi:hypothetical protein